MAEIGKLNKLTDVRPLEVGDFACLKVVEVNKVGAFLDWGLKKDLMVPYREQEPRMTVGQSYLVRVYVDRSGRTAASARLDRFLDQGPCPLKVGEAVELIIAKKTDIGYKAIINNSHWGVFYFDEVFESIHYGQRLSGFIKKIRSDSKIDLCLQKPGYDKISGIAGKIMTKLETEGGFIAVTDKSPPELIKQHFGISKKSYKTAVGTLYKKRKITIEPDGIRIKQPEGK